MVSSMPLTTTTVGPHRVADAAKRAEPSHNEGDAQASLEAAIRAIVQEQDELGIDIPVEGAASRPQPVHDHLRRMPGIEWLEDAPHVRGAVRPGPRFLRHAWKAAQAATHKPVKVTLPGPLTLTAAVADDHYGDARRLAAALGDALNHEIRDLAEAGCPWIQLDEPAFARQPEVVLAYAIDDIARCFHKVPRETWRAVHLPSSFPEEMDQEEIPAAEPEAYASVIYALAEAPLHAVGLQHAHSPIDRRLLEAFDEAFVMLGVVDVARSEVELLQTIRDRLKAALEHIDPPRLLAAPDGGLALLPPAVVRQKLENLVAAARSL